MSQKNPEQKLPNYNTSLAATILCSLEIIGFGVFLLVVHFKPEVLGGGYTALEILLPSALFALWLISFTYSALLKNTLTFWMSFIFLICGIVWVAVERTQYTYAQLWPTYVAIPAIASLFTLPFSRDKNAHLKSIILFGATSILLFMYTMDIIEPIIIISATVIVVGGFIITSAITSRKGTWDQGDRPQRQLTEQDIEKLGYNAPDNKEDKNGVKK